jgi:hypothetical protein
MSTPGPRKERRRARPTPPPVGRVGGPDGVERDVYEDADGRQYILGPQGEKVFGLWLLETSARPPIPREEDAPAEESADETPLEEARGADEELPWEEQGAIRRDREPHRARMLSLLGTITFCLGVMAVPSGAPGVFGLSLGLYVRSAARRDLRKMDDGTMDPEGAERTRAALQDANLGSALSGLGLLLAVFVVVGLLFYLT